MLTSSDITTPGFYWYFDAIGGQPCVGWSSFSCKLVRFGRIVPSKTSSYEYLNFRLTVLFVQIGAFWLSGPAHFSWDASLPTDNPDVARVLHKPTWTSPRSVGKRCRVAVDMSQIAATDQAAALQAAAQRLIADGCSWITASQLAQWAGVSPATLDQWKRDKRIFSVMRQGIEVFPEYLFDAQHRSLPAAEATLLLLHEYDGDRLAAWFESTSSFLGGRRPRELLAADPGRVAAAARDAIERERFAS